MAAQAGQEAVTGAVQRTEAWCRGWCRGQGQTMTDLQTATGRSGQWREAGTETEAEAETEAETGDILLETFQYYDPADQHSD